MKYLISILISIIFISTNSVLAKIDCLKISFDSPQTERDYCENELRNIEKELEDLLRSQKEQGKKSGILKKDIDLLNTKINELKKKIDERKAIINKLNLSIKNKEKKIRNLHEKINNQHNSLSQLTRDVNLYDNKDIFYLAFSDNDLSSFYQDLVLYNILEEETKKLVLENKENKYITEDEKTRLEEQEKNETKNLNKLESKKTTIKKEENKKNRELIISQKKEIKLAESAAKKRAKAEAIRAALFPLRDSVPIPFEKALEYAKIAEKTTMVEPAFLLAIFKQESNLGSNVGSCYLTNDITGAGMSIKTGKIFGNVMHPRRDVNPFFQIVTSLGGDPWKTRVSCPIGNSGYGGAMGPAQFIASTWNLIKNKVANALDIKTPNPWNPRDAFMASSIYLSEIGGSGKNYKSQIKAACRYYGSGGSNCNYGRSVLALMKKIKKDIDFIEENI